MAVMFEVDSFIFTKQTKLFLICTVCGAGVHELGNSVIQ